jgi:hypothetical protein
LSGKIKRNPENPCEYHRLPLVDYGLADISFPHNKHYLEAQQRIYRFMREGHLRSTVVDIGRGCIKFTNNMNCSVDSNACDFCGIVPGGKAIMPQTTERAWAILKNVYEQGFNYFYITADELPLTLWGLLRSMLVIQPDWYKKLSASERPKMFGYARAEGFNIHPERIDKLVGVLGFNHFMVGFDGLSRISLEVMNKGSFGNKKCDLFKQNVEALQKVVKSGCLITAGFVVTHLGITQEIMEENYRNLEEAISLYPTTFAELDFAPLCPIPGSKSFRYLKDPEFARRQAEKFGLSVNISYLQSMSSKYFDRDLLDMEDLAKDFILGCCPKISMDYLDEYLQRISLLANKYSIAIGGGV